MVASFFTCIQPTMGLTQSVPKYSSTLADALATLPKSPINIHVERMIDGDCDYLPPTMKRKQLLIGLCSGLDEKNPIQNQCMKLGEYDPQPLMAFAEVNNCLQYTFAGDTTMIVAKRDTGEVYYHLKTPTYDVTHSIHPAIRKLYKPIGGSLTLELDKLGALMKTEQA